MPTKADTIRSTFAASAEAVIDALGTVPVPPPTPPAPPPVPPVPVPPPVPPVIPPTSWYPVRAVVTLACGPVLPNVPFSVRLSVVGRNPTGTVSVDDQNQASTKASGALLGTGNQRSVDFVLTLPTGRYMLVGRYSGDANNLANTSDGIALNVGGTVVAPVPPVEPPSVEGETLLAVNFRSRADIEANFVGIAGYSPAGTPTPAPPGLDTIQYIPLDPEGFPGVTAARLWAAVGKNERFISWHHPFEPKVRAFGDGYEHLVFEYLLRVGEDVGAGMVADGTKLLGFSGLYDLDAGGVTLPTPKVSIFAGWETRLWHGPETVLGYRLACYAYLTRDPRNGSSATVGKYGGSGNPNGPLMTSGYLVPGKLHRIRQEVRLNTVKNKALIVPTATASADQIAELIDNCNLDGLLRISLDGRVVGEWTTVGYRGLDRARIYELFPNIYAGGYGIYPRSPSHYDLADVRVTVRKPAGTAPPPVIPPPVIPPVVPPIVPPVIPPVVPSGPLATIAPGTARNLGSWPSDDPDGVGIAAYGTIVPDTVGNQMVSWGGPHHPLGQTSVRVMSLAAPFVWRSLYPTMPPAARLATDKDHELGRYISTNHRIAFHSYNSLVVVGRRMYTTGGFGHIAWYDLDHPQPGSPGSWHYSAEPMKWYYAHASVEVNNKILIATSGMQASGWAAIWLYDPATDSSVQLPATYGIGGLGGSRTPSLVYYPPNGKHYIFADKGVWELTFDAASPRASTCVQMVTTGAGPMGYLSLDYDPVNKVIAGLNGTAAPDATGEWFTFRPETGAWKSSTIVCEGSAEKPTMWFNAGKFTPSGCYIALAITTGYPTWAVRPPA